MRNFRPKYPSQQSSYNQPNLPIGTVLNGMKLTSNGWQPYKKKSGAKEIRTDKAGKQLTDRNGKPVIGLSAWCYTKRTGLISISGFSHYKSKWYENAKGEEGVSIVCEVVYKDSGVTKIIPVAYNAVTGKAYLKEIGLMLSTKGANGGFCGQMSFNKK